MSDTKTITINQTGGPIVIRVASDRFPQSIAGIIWRYDSAKKYEGKSGRFRTQVSEVALGVPENLVNKFFLVEGAVFHQSDSPPTPYQVEVTISQDGKILEQEIPDDKGEGSIGTENVAFVYKFQLV